MAHRATQGANIRGGDFDPNDARAGKGNFSFQGDRLVGVIPYDAGARQITVTFDPGFSSCTATVIEGHSGGGTIRRKGPNGMMYEISGASTSSPAARSRAATLSRAVRALSRGAPVDGADRLTESPWK